MSTSEQHPPNSYALYESQLSQVRSNPTWETAEESLRAWVESARAQVAADDSTSRNQLPDDHPDDRVVQSLRDVLAARRVLLEEHGEDAVDRAIFSAANDCGLWRDGSLGKANPAQPLADQFAVQNYQIRVERGQAPAQEGLLREPGGLSYEGAVERVAGYDLWGDDAGIDLE